MFSHREREPDIVDRTDSDHEDTSRITPEMLGGGLLNDFFHSRDCKLYLSVRCNLKAGIRCKSDVITRNVILISFNGQVVKFRASKAVKGNIVVVWQEYEFYGEDSVTCEVLGSESKKSISMSNLWSRQCLHDKNVSQFSKGNFCSQFSFNFSEFYLTLDYRIAPIRSALHVLDSSNNNSLHSLARFAPVDLFKEVLISLGRNNTIDVAFCATDFSGLTSFDLALERGCSEAVKMMLSYWGGKCLSKSKGGFACPLHSAVLGGSFECVKLIITFLRKYGPVTLQLHEEIAHLRDFMEWRDEEDCTPLLRACEQPNSIEIVKLLIYYGADMTFQSSSTGASCFLSACRAKNYTVCEFLLRFKKTTRELMFDFPNRVIRKSIKPWQYLKCNPCFRDNNGLSSVLVLAADGNIALLSALYGMGVSYNEADNDGNNIFHSCIMNNRIDVLEKVLNWEISKWRNYGTDEVRLESRRNFLANNLFSRRNHSGMSSIMLAKSKSLHTVVTLLESSHQQILSAFEPPVKNVEVGSSEMKDGRDKIVFGIKISLKRSISWFHITRGKIDDRKVDGSMVAADANDKSLCSSEKIDDVSDSYISSSNEIKLHVDDSKFVDNFEIHDGSWRIVDDDSDSVEFNLALAKSSR